MPFLGAMLTPFANVAEDFAGHCLCQKGGLYEITGKYLMMPYSFPGYSH